MSWSTPLPRDAGDGADAGAGAASRGPSGLPRLLAGLDPSGSTMTLAEHRAEHGPLPEIAGPELIDAVARSGLRGRGGADFPTATKLRSVAERRGGAALVINGSETEPASAKDRLLLARLPHLVLDGAALAARAVGAREAIIKIGDGTPAVQRSLEGAWRFAARTRSRSESSPAPRATSPARRPRCCSSSAAASPSPPSCRRGRTSAACADAPR